MFALPLGSPSDEALVDGALAGSQRAWARLVRRYERRLYNHALRMVSQPDDAMDLVQDVFLAVHRNLHGWRREGPFAAWLFRIATFRSTDLLRRRRPVDSLDDRADEPLADPSPDKPTSPAGFNERLDANARITDALSALPAEQRLVVELKFFQHFTFEDIARQLGCSPNTAKSRLYTALRKLRSHEELQDAL